jgi:hypothetical protein
MQTYGPLRSKVFGSPKIRLWLKLHFMRTLILSRLLFHAQVWVHNIKSTRILNGPYMRCLRKIAGHSRFDAKCDMSDLQVRMRLIQPSIDCLLMRKRLAFAARIIGARCQVLRVLLSQVDLPWCKLLRSDLLYMHANHCDDISSLCKIHVTNTCIQSPAEWLAAICHPR